MCSSDLIAHLAEAFGMNCEVHDSYNALNNVAGLHVMMAIDNCDWLEVLAFNRAGDHSLGHLGYHWFEDPFPTHDMHSYVRLGRHLSIPLLATEISPGGLAALPPWITSGATDFLRGDVVIKGGITGLMKIAHLAEAFGMNCEVHDSYNALNNVAARHVMMAIDNCDWLEVLAFNRAGDHSLGQLGYGLTEPFAVDSGGEVHAPAGPGLGAGIDWDLINSAVVAVAS